MRIERENAVLAWHFLPSDGRLQHKHNGSRGSRINPGDVLHAQPPLMICCHGLHASRRAIDALKYAPGAIICRVACWGEIQEHENDKLCAEFREVLWLADCDHELHEFACVIATQALDAQANNGFTVDPRSRNAIAVKRLWIKGEASAEDLNAAWNAAGDAAWNAANSLLESVLFALEPQDIK